MSIATRRDTTWYAVAEARVPYFGKIVTGCSRHHVECRFGHICVGVVGCLVPVELAFHCADVDNVFVNLAHMHDGAEARVSERSADCQIVGAQRWRLALAPYG